MQSLHDSLNAAVEDVGDVLEQDVSGAGFLCQAYDFEEKARLLSLQAASSSEIADIRARKPGGDDVDGLGAGDVPGGEGADVVPDRGGGKVSGMHSCCDACVGGRGGWGREESGVGDGALDRTRGWVRFVRVLGSAEGAEGSFGGVRHAAAGRGTSETEDVSHL